MEGLKWRWQDYKVQDEGNYRRGSENIVRAERIDMSFGKENFGRLCVVSMNYVEEDKMVWEGEKKLFLCVSLLFCLYKKLSLVSLKNDLFQTLLQKSSKVSQKFL